MKNELSKYSNNSEKKDLFLKPEKCIFNVIEVE